MKARRIYPLLNEHYAKLFWAKVKPPLGIGECWEWQGVHNAHGYGVFGIRENKFYAHRLSYENLIGPIGDYNIDHLCKHPSCVNPYHLEPVTQRENLLRSDGPMPKLLARTHCPRGHPLIEGNLDKWSARLGRRKCATCNRDRVRESYRIKRAQIA